MFYIQKGKQILKVPVMYINSIAKSPAVNWFFLSFHHWKSDNDFDDCETNLFIKVEGCTIFQVSFLGLGLVANPVIQAVGRLEFEDLEAGFVYHRKDSRYS